MWDNCLYVMYGAESEECYMEHSILAGRLKAERFRRGLTRLEAAKGAGVNRHTLTDAENAKRRPTNETLQKICDFYGLNMEDVLEEAYSNPLAVASQGEEGHSWEEEPPPLLKVEMSGSTQQRRAFGSMVITNPSIFLTEEDLQRLLQGEPATGLIESEDGQRVRVPVEAADIRPKSISAGSSDTPLEKVEAELSALSPEDFRKIALSVVPQDYWLAIVEHRNETLQWAKVWMHERGLIIDDVRRALEGMAPFAVKRLLDLEEQQADTLYEGILLEGVRVGEVTPGAFKVKREGFRVKVRTAGASAEVRGTGAAG